MKWDMWHHQGSPSWPQATLFCSHSPGVLRVLPLRASVSWSYLEAPKRPKAGSLTGLTFPPNTAPLGLLKAQAGVPSPALAGRGLSPGSPQTPSLLPVNELEASKMRLLHHLMDRNSLRGRGDGMGEEMNGGGRGCCHPTAC